MSSSPPSSRSDAIGRILHRLGVTANAVRPAFPLAADVETGKWQTASDGRWTGGFWVGMLWLAHYHTGEPRYAVLAREWMERLSPRIRIANVLNGLVFYYGAVLGAVLASDGGARSLAIEAGTAFARTYNSVAGIFPLGGDTTEIIDPAAVETNIDGLAGMALLYWAADAAIQPALRVQALSHAHHLKEACQRAGGSFYQAASFDRASGRILRRYTPRGYAQDSTWARAQSWGLLGLVQSARHDATVLPATQAIADFWITRTEADLVAFWDFDDPAIPNVERDTSATAMAACALLKLALLVDDPNNRRRYRVHAEATIDRLVSGFLTPTRPDDCRPPGMLTEGCWQRKQSLATKHELIWGDYFLLESLLELESPLPSI